MITKEQKFGAFSTLIFVVITFILLMIFGFSAPYPPPEEEGILINFGTDELGIGKIEPKPSSQPIENEPINQEESIPEPQQNTDHSEEEVLTQDFDKTALIEEQKKKKQEEEEQKRKKQEEKEKKRLEKIEQERIAKEKAEQQLREQKQKEINERIAGAFGGKNTQGDNSGEGDTKGNGNQGNPEGDINSQNRIGTGSGGNGISFSLNGRSSRSLPPPPKIHKTEGKVVVEVTVDQSGNVISARPGVRGSTITDAALLKVAKEAARKAKFNVNKDAPTLQTGTITYLFGFE